MLAGLDAETIWKLPLALDLKGEAIIDISFYGQRLQQFREQLQSMKTGVFVVSSYKIEGGIIRVGQTSPENSAAKTSYTMDEAIAKLRRVLVSIITPSLLISISIYSTRAIIILEPKSVIRLL